MKLKFDYLTKGDHFQEDHVGTLQDMHSQCVLRYQIHVGTSAQVSRDAIRLFVSQRPSKTPAGSSCSIHFFVQNVLILTAAVLVVWCRLVHDDLDHKVLLDLGVLQAGLVREELSREEPALVGQVNVLLSL